MRRCPNCSQTASDDRKICRNCGGILVNGADEPAVEAVVSPETVEPDRQFPQDEPRDILEESSLDDSAVPAEQARRDRGEEEADEHTELHQWRCPQCHVGVPRSFDLCWNCQTSRPPDAEHSQESAPQTGLPTPPPVQAEVVEAQIIEERDFRQSTCPVCGSAKIMRNVVIRDQGDGAIGKLHVVIPGNPSALVFKDRRYGNIQADICGQCGNIQLRVKNPASLYAHYMKARKSR